MKQKFLTVREVSEILRVKPKTLYQWKWMKQNLVFVKVGGSLKIREKDLLDFIERNTKKPEEASE
jgi:excisionase family DNA binding protein